MKYLKLYEQIGNYEVKVMTADEFVKFFFNRYGYHGDYDLKNKIKYFSWDDLSKGWGSDKHYNSQRFIVAYNDKDILGICKFAWWEIGDQYSISYISTNNEYYKQGISKKNNRRDNKIFFKKISQ